jgi:hypothetical protein
VEGRVYVTSSQLYFVMELHWLSVLYFPLFRTRWLKCKYFLVSLYILVLILEKFISIQVMGLSALGIPAYMLTSTTNKEVEKFIYKTLDKGEGELKILYVTPEKISKSKRFMSKLEKCHHAGRLSLIAIDVSNYKLIFFFCQQCPQLFMTFTYPGFSQKRILFVIHL